MSFRVGRTPEEAENTKINTGEGGFTGENKKTRKEIKLLVDFIINYKFFFFFFKISLLYHWIELCLPIWDWFVLIQLWTNFFNLEEDVVLQIISCMIFFNSRFNVYEYCSCYFILFIQLSDQWLNWVCLVNFCHFGKGKINLKNIE